MLNKEKLIKGHHFSIYFITVFVLCHLVIGCQAKVEIFQYEGQHHFGENFDKKSPSILYQQLTRPIKFKIGESKIFYVRLPPAPYILIPGIGYISNPPLIQPISSSSPSSSSLDSDTHSGTSSSLNHYYSLENLKPDGFEINSELESNEIVDLNNSYDDQDVQIYDGIDDSKIIWIDNLLFVSNGKPVNVYQLK